MKLINNIALPYIEVILNALSDKQYLLHLFKCNKRRLLSMQVILVILHASNKSNVRLTLS